MSRLYSPWTMQGDTTNTRLALEFPDVMTVNTGTLTDGVVADVATIGGTVVDVNEVVDTPGFDIVFDWAGVVGVPTGIRIAAYYAGGANHSPTVDLYDYVAAGFVTLEGLYDATAMHTFHLPANKNFVSAGAMQLRFYHASGGNGTHHMWIDYIAAEMWRE